MSTSPIRPPAGRRESVEQLRNALNHLLGADRRLRGRDHSRPGELTFAQLRTIAALGRQEAMTAGQLARSADLTPAAVTAILDQLESTGIVKRRRSVTDRRVCNVLLTPEGWELLERKLDTWQQLWEERMAEFSEEELATAIRVADQATALLDGVNRKLAAAAEQAGA